MAWNLSVSYNEFELITWFLRDAIVSVWESSKWVLVCIWLKRWMDISGLQRGGGPGMDGVRWTWEYCTLAIDFCFTSPNDRRCDELNFQGKT